MRRSGGRGARATGPLRDRDCGAPDVPATTEESR